ncbi:MAG: 30S ribosomal protein S12 methylthiotransferase RimO [Deltaproteobacteria bacterium]|nr:30S ribosomal protein S12 methylthiotransferase RimO [Deltaproteobacteria bacterium]
METIGIISLGCARNLVDSEVMVGSLKKAGYHIAQDPTLCDVIIVNTCGFIEASKKESIDTILEMAGLKKKGRLKKLVMAGCLSQRYSTDLAEAMPEVDLFIGTGEFPKVAELLVGQERVAVGKPRALADETFSRILATPSHSAYLKLAEGCQHACSFCVIPKLRGPLRSRSIESLVIETKQLMDQGVKEFNMIAQDSTGYGKDRKDGATLLGLMQSLTKLKGEKWFRLFYAYPHGFPFEVVDFMQGEPELCNYLDMPIQHMSDRILQSMRREGTAKDIRNIIEGVRRKIPDVTLRTTCIVGYPGETDAEFKELVDFVAEGHFDHVGVFTYSEEEGTSAAKLKDDISAKIKRERKKTLMQVQQRVSKSRNEKWIGKTVRVLVDGPSKESPLVITGRHEGQAPDVDGIVYINECDLPAGTFAKVKITEAHEYDLVGGIA